MSPNQPNGSSDIRIHRRVFGPDLAEDGQPLPDRIEIISQHRGQFSYLLDGALKHLNQLPDTTTLFKAPKPSNKKTEPVGSSELSKEDIALMDSLNSASSKVGDGIRAFFS